VLTVCMHRSGAGRYSRSRWCAPCVFITVTQIVLETEVVNTAALHLYESLGFVRDKRLPHYYLNGNDAYRLKVWLREPDV